MKKVFDYLIKNRIQFLLGIVLVYFISFILSKAVLSITNVLLLFFFFMDKKENIYIKLNSILSNKIVLFYSLFFLVQLVGVLYSSNKITAIRQVVLALPILFLPAILSVEIISSSLKLYIMKILRYIILIIFIYLLIIHIIYNGHKLNTFVLYTINDKLGVSQVFISYMLLIPLIISFMELREGTSILFNTILFLTTLFFFLLLGNKTVLLFLFVYAIMISFKAARYKLKIGFFLISLTIILSLLSYQVPIVKAKINTVIKTTDFNIDTIITKNKFTLTKNTFEHRLLINYVSFIEIIKAFPFGVGTGDFQERLNTQYKKIHFKFGIKNKLNNHNQYLAEFLKTGVLGGLTFCYLIYLLLKESFKNKNYSIPFVLLFALGCLTESYLSRQHGVSVFAFIIPFFLWDEQDNI